MIAWYFMTWMFCFYETSISYIFRMSIFPMSYLGDFVCRTVNFFSFFYLNFLIFKNFEKNKCECMSCNLCWVLFGMNYECEKKFNQECVTEDIKWFQTKFRGLNLPQSKIFTTLEIPGTTLVFLLYPSFHCIDDSFSQWNRAVVI